MHVFLLIMALGGQPERTVEVCDTYKACSDAGAAVSAEYQTIFHKSPSDVTYRVIPAVVRK